jgi:hypothetical protein
MIFSVTAAGQQGAQEQVKQFERQVIIEGAGPGFHAEPFTWVAAEGQGENTFVFVSSEMSFGGKVVKGAPYSAEAVTESVQLLADGNRIVRKTTASIYRDSQGRTRHEQTLHAIGPFAAAGEAPRTVSIFDPVAGVTFVVNEKNSTARKISIQRPKIRVQGAGGDHEKALKSGKVKIHKGGDHEVVVEAPHGVRGGAAQMRTHDVVTMHKMHGGEAKTDSLGRQVIEGVEAEGARKTHTIPAGEIGNEQPINIVFEEWYSPELQVVVMRKSTDPRFGETTYRLTNINRSEPASSLFEVPGNYTIKEDNLKSKFFVEKKHKEEK